MINTLRDWVSIGQTWLYIIMLVAGPNVGHLFAQKDAFASETVLVKVDQNPSEDQTERLATDNERRKWMVLRYILLCMSVDHRSDDGLGDINDPGNIQAEVRAFQCPQME